MKDQCIGPTALRCGYDEGDAISKIYPNRQGRRMLERKITSGIGKCGRCKDGPVFTYAQLQQIPEAVL